jgi:hypothetical protein
MSGNNKRRRRRSEEVRREAASVVRSSVALLPVALVALPCHHDGACLLSALSSSFNLRPKFHTSKTLQWNFFLLPL